MMRRGERVGVVGIGKEQKISGEFCQTKDLVHVANY